MLRWKAQNVQPSVLADTQEGAPINQVGGGLC